MRVAMVEFDTSSPLESLGKKVRQRATVSRERNLKAFAKFQKELQFRRR